MPVQYSYTSTPPIARTAFTEPQCLYSTAIPLPPLWPYGLYRASVPVQYSYTSTPPIGRTACTEPECLYSTAIPLLPLWAVRPVNSLGACTRVHFTFYSTPAPQYYSTLSINSPILGGKVIEHKMCFVNFSTIFV